ncbi:hypothetical protein CU254_41940 (plasmid) [Amycolatopsis sp. AA4]|uniref:hypothetical protein n=1 Tax=Actinomycetes TaxID=1760 RepID=UPI0001B56C23|nr:MULTISPECIES: hypothetical protein [Actinomycetes]ATY17141.1 hypothetical protein CU254_41940 [Amycolatopsis sp. AA4]
MGDTANAVRAEGDDIGTSQTITPDEVLQRLYAAADGRHLPWLDELAIAAGLRDRCWKCGAMVGIDERCDQCGAVAKEPAVAAVLASLPGPAATRLADQGYRYLIARTADGAGIYLIRDDNGEIADFTAAIHEECVQEGTAAGLNPVYHVHACCNLVSAEEVHWHPVPLPPAHTSPAFVVAQDDPIPFAVDEAALTQWVSRPEDWEGRLPDRAAEAPGDDLSVLVCDALAQHVLTGDPRIDLQVIGDDDSDSAGYRVVLHNKHGDQRLVGITSGWSELDFPADENTALAEAARFHVDQVCTAANSVLAELETSPAPADSLQH